MSCTYEMLQTPMNQGYFLNNCYSSYVSNKSLKLKKNNNDLI